MAARPPRVFLLSPARCDGERAKLLLNPAATFPLAVRLRDEGVAIGDVFAFLSGLYFRGKLAYARAFASRLRRVPPILVITTDRGLVPPETRVTRDDLIAFSSVDLAGADERYLRPLKHDVDRLTREMSPRTSVVLLGSIATGKYADVLLVALGERVLFPASFVGRGDMSRGGLMLRHARSGVEMEYIPVIGAVRRGTRPPKLERLPRRADGEARP